MAMKTKRPGSTVLRIGAAILWLVHSTGAQSGETFRARLSTVPIDLTMMSTVAGSGSLTAVLSGKKLTIAGTFDGLRSPATIARVHRGPRGIRGPAMFDLAVSKATSGTVSGSLELTPAQIEDLRSGRFYVQIHSEGAPDGNLWGWLLR
jgi:CHRD domain